MDRGNQKGVLRLSRWGLCGVTLAPLIGGCATTTTHSDGGADYTRYVMSLYDKPSADRAPANLNLPMKIAVAEVGEATPSTAIVERLRAAKDVCQVICGLPAVGPTEAATESARQSATALTRLAQDQGADYLLLFGATVEGTEQVTPLSALDLTIVGAYVVPDRELSATARSSAALVDVRSGRVALICGTQFDGARVTTAAASGGDQANLDRQTRDEATIRLVDRFIAEAKGRASRGSQGTPADTNGERGS